MGVRGKIEDVIYAAEEPVTLAQLASLFGEEILAEREAAEAGTPGAQAEELPFDSTAAPEGTQETSVADTPDEAQGVEKDSAAIAAEGQPQIALEEPFEASGEPVLIGDPDADKRASRLRERRAREAVRGVLESLMADYAAGERGMEIREIAGGYRVATKPEYHDAVRAFVKSLKPPMKLSLQALETLAVIAYKQPVTAPEVAEIRGVDSGGVMGSLISRKLVTTAGRKQVVGRPILYKTTREFLLRFGLKDLAELPSMEEFEKMASELESLEGEPAGEAAPLLPAEVSVEESEPEPDGPVIAVDEAEPELPGISVDNAGAATIDSAGNAPAETVKAEDRTDG